MLFCNSFVLLTASCPEAKISIPWNLRLMQIHVCDFLQLYVLSPSCYLLNQFIQPHLKSSYQDWSLQIEVHWLKKEGPYCWQSDLTKKTHLALLILWYDLVSMEIMYHVYTLYCTISLSLMMQPTPETMCSYCIKYQFVIKWTVSL